MLADDLQELEFNILVSRKGMFIGRVRGKFGAEYVFYFALSVSEDAEWTRRIIASADNKNSTCMENQDRLTVDFKDQEHAFQQKSGSRWPLKAGNREGNDYCMLLSNLRPLASDSDFNNMF